MSGSYRIVRICALLPAIYGLIAARSLTRPDSAKVQADLAKAEEAAGTMWTSEERFFCGRPKGNRADDPILEAASLFDNLYVMCRRDTAGYALKTEAGILLIDSGYQADVESVLLDGMKKLGLDSAQVKRVVITHGHGDHFGGALYLQEHFGAQVYLSEAEWNLMEHPVAGRGDGKAPQAPPPATPKHAMVMKDGQPIVLGGLKITPVSIPGHTPGSMGLIFPVHDNGTMHMAGFGGTMLGGVLEAFMDQLETYQESIAHRETEIQKAQVDVELQNHRLFDNFAEKMARLKERKSQDPNPFIVG